jgi:hypothetical protein
MTTKKKLTHEHLVEVLRYDPATGVFVWKIARSNRVKVGSRAGVFHHASGGRYISIDNEKFMAHRLAFFYVNKRWPNTDVRPFDDDYDNCAINNLKEIPRVALQHMRGKIKTNSSGFPGVSRAKHGRWQAKITWNYEQINLGASFETAEDAAEMYNEAARRLKEGVATQEQRDQVLDELKTWRRQRTVWNHLNRCQPSHTWSSFEEFCATITAWPKLRYAMVARDARQPIGPSNYQWTMPIDADGGLVGADYNAAVRDAKRDHYRDKDFRKKYRISYADYMALWEKQGGVCACCQRVETKMQFGRVRMLSVDHDHDTDAVRGLLCGNCNHGIGMFGNDRPDLLRAAADYLDRYYGRKLPASD